LAEAPRRVVLASDDDGLAELIEPFAADLETRPRGDISLTLKPGAQAHDILERSVAEGVRLSKYEPIRPTLHEAFVTLVGDDVRQDMNLNAGSST